MSDIGIEAIAWCPTQHGTFTAYKAEWRFKENDWQEVPSVFDNDSRGVPYPLQNGGIALTIGLMGYEQAHAVAWGYAAQVAAQGQYVEVRVQPYEVVYDIKARIET